MGGSSPDAVTGEKPFYRSRLSSARPPLFGDVSSAMAIKTGERTCGICSRSELLFLSNLSHQAWLHAAVVQLPIFRFLLVRSVLRAARSRGL